MGIITKADALAAMQGGVIPTAIQAIINHLPSDDDKFNAQMFIVVCFVLPIPSTGGNCSGGIELDCRAEG